MKKKSTEKKRGDTSRNCFMDKTSQNISVNDLVSGDNVKVAFPENRTSGVFKGLLCKHMGFFGDVLGEGEKIQRKKTHLLSAGCSQLPCSASTSWKVWRVISESLYCALTNDLS